jgi:hypothetical protein
MEAAGNPLHNFKQIECPDVIRKRYWVILFKFKKNYLNKYI